MPPKLCRFVLLASGGTEYLDRPSTGQVPGASCRRQTVSCKSRCAKPGPVPEDARVERTATALWSPDWPPVLKPYSGLCCSPSDAADGGCRAFFLSHD